MQSRYSVKFDELGDISHANGVECVVTLFSFTSKFKFTVSFPIRPDEVIDFPQVNVAEWKVEKMYGDIR